MDDSTPISPGNQDFASVQVSAGTIITLAKIGSSAAIVYLCMVRLANGDVFASSVAELATSCGLSGKMVSRYLDQFVVAKLVRIDSMADDEPLRRSTGRATRYKLTQDIQFPPPSRRTDKKLSGGRTSMSHPPVTTCPTGRTSMSHPPVTTCPTGRTSMSHPLIINDITTTSSTPQRSNTNLINGAVGVGVAVVDALSEAAAKLTTAYSPEEHGSRIVRMVKHAGGVKTRTWWVADRAAKLVLIDGFPDQELSRICNEVVRRRNLPTSDEYYVANPAAYLQKVIRKAAADHGNPWPEAAMGQSEATA